MNVQEVLKISKERKIKNKEATKKILDNIHKKIKYYATMKKETCVYVIPPIIEEHLIYDIESVIKEIFKTLDSEGYIVTAYPNGQLDICWNERLVEEKVKTDAYLLKVHEHKLKNLTKKHKNIDQRFAFLANPKKTAEKEKSIDEQLDEQVEKILRQREKTQKKFSKLLKN
jgi:hypothetical protein